jgi:3-hydroxyacyl-CoA dehydrogenase
MTVVYERRGELAVLQIDNPPVNGLSAATRAGLQAGLERALADGEVRAIVITGTAQVFSAGADIREFGGPAMLAHPDLREVIANVDAAAKPVIAAINGTCFGGGLELALGCNYRIATPGAKMGLPEVKIGLLPGAGGTQRLPRAIGADKALRMIVSGDPIGAREALEAGLIERIVPDTSFDGVIAFAQEVAPSGRNHHPRLRERSIRLPPGADDAGFIQAAHDSVARETRGRMAPRRCVDAVEAALTMPFEQGLVRERELFAELVQSDESKALRHAFFAERAAARIPDIPEDTALRPIRRAAVIGCGTMGGGIAMSLANAGLPVLVYEADAAALDRGLANCRRNWEASARKGRLTPEQVEQRVALLQPAGGWQDLSKADIVIEAVFEELPVKLQVFRELDKVARRGAILATNTSTLDVDAIARATGRPQDVIGTHFFAPANVMRLLEVVRGRETARDVLATVMQWGRRIGKVAVVSGVCDGFIGNRMLEHYLRQALFLVDEGAAPQQIDAALTRFGFAMGPFAVSDLSGLDIGYAIRQRRYRERPDVRYSGIADRLVEMGRLGQKTGKGWYRYEAGDRTPREDPEVEALIAQHRASIGIAPRAISDQEVVERCVYALVNEGARILEEGIALRAGDIDVVYLTGYGFPATRGGPMFHAETVGLEQVVAAMQRFRDNPNADPVFWEPAPLLRRSAAQGGRFDKR